MVKAIKTYKKPRISNVLLQKHILNSQNNLIVAVDRDGKILFVNEAYCKFISKSEKELLESNFLPFIFPDAMKANGELTVIPHYIEAEQRVLTENGWRWILWEDTANVAEDGNVIEIVAVGRDITKEKELLLFQQSTNELLKGIAAATTTLLTNKDSSEAIQHSIEILGKSVNADRCYLFSIIQNSASKEFFARQDFEWSAEGITSQVSNPENQHSYIEKTTLFSDYFKKSLPYYTTIADIHEELFRKHLESQQIKSILLIPINIDNVLVGFIGFDDCTREREWQLNDVNFLTTAANAIGSVLHKDKFRQSSIEHQQRAEAALKASELGLWDWNIQTDGVFYSLGFKHLFGYEDEEFASDTKEWRKRIHPDDAQLVFKKIDDYLKGVTPVYFSEHRFLKKDGTYIWILDKGQIIEYDQFGKPLRMIGTNTNIESKQAKLILAEENELRLNGLLKSIPDNIMIFSRDLVIQECIINNPEDMLMPREMFIGKKLPEVLPPAICDLIVPNLLKCFSTREQIQFEYSIPFDDGDKIFESRLVPYAENKLIAIIRNITESSTLKKELQKSESNFRTLVNSLTDIIIQLDNNLNLISFNGNPDDSHLVLQGISSFDPDERLNDNPVIEVFKQKAKNVLTGISATHDFESISFAGEITNWHLSLSPLRDDNNSIIGVVVVARNVTEIRNADKRLTISESKLREAQNIAKIANWEYNIETDELLWSDYIFELLKISYTNSLSNFNLLISLIHIDDRRIFLAAFNKILKLHEPFEVSFRVVLSGGVIKYIECKGIYFESYHGLSNRIVGTALDITHIKLAQKALIESEERFRNLFYNHSATMLIVDPGTGNIIQANTSAEKFYGYNTEQICSMNISELNILTPLQIKEKMKEAIGQNRNYFIFPHRLSNGQVKTVEVHSSPIMISGKQVLFSIIHDITDRKHAEDLVLQVRQNYESFFNTIDELLFVLDEQGNIIHENNTVIERLGYTKEELTGNSILMVHPVDRREEAGRIVGEMLNGSTEVCSVPVISKDGTQIPVETRVTPGVWDGKPALFGVTKDISKITLSEEKFSKVFYVNPSACGLSDLVTNEYIEVNEAFYELFGFSEEEVIGKTPIELGILSLDTIMSMQSEIDSDGKLTNVEVDLRTKSGYIKHVLISGENIYIQNRVLRYTVVNDITERRLAEDEMRQSNQRLQAIISASPDGIGMISFDGSLELVSDKLAEMYGFSIDQKFEMIGKSAFDFIDPLDHKKLKENLSKLLKGDSDFGIREYRAVKKDGEKFYIDLNYSLLNDSAGKPKSILFIERDITERKKAVEALQQSEEKFRTIIETSPDSIGMFDIDANVVMMNPVAAVIFGFDSPEDMLGWNALQFFLPEDHASALGLIQEVFTNGMVRNAKYTLVRKNGTTFSSEFSCSALYDEAGKPKGILAFTRDITERKLAEETLLWNETLLKLMSNSSPLGFLVVDNRTDDILYYNQRFCQIWGIEHISGQMARGEMKNNDIIPHCLPVLADIPAFAESCKPLQSETNRIVLEDEIAFTENRTVRRFSTQIRGENDEYYGRFYIFEDITERKQAQETILKREKQYHQVVDNIQEIIFQTDLVGLWSFLNPAWEEITGFSLDESIGHSFLDFVYPADRQRNMELFEPLINRKKEYCRYEIRYITKSGGFCWMEVFAKLGFNDAGEITGTFGTLMDITAKKNLLEKNESLNQQFQNFFSIMADGVYLFDIKQRKVIYLNSSIGKITGYSIDEIEEKDDFLSCIVHPEDSEILAESRKELAENKHSSSEFRIISKNGKTIWIWDRNWMVDDEDGLPLRVEGLWSDITISKESEERIKKSLAQEIALNELKSRFISTASHEFRTPLTTILSSAELLEHYGMRWTEEKRQTHIQRIQQSVLGMRALLNDVIFLNRSEANKTPVTLSEGNLRELCAQIIEDFTQSQDWQTTINYEYNLGKDVLVFDEKLMRQILTNLIGNAVKYSHELSPIDVKVEKDKGGFQIIISDKGLGIPEDEQDLIFNTFFRAKNSIHIEGTGLGLSIVKHSVDSHSGTVNFVSGKDKGTTFFVHIPFLKLIT